MKNNMKSILFLLLIALSLQTPAHALGGREAGASLILPTTGQAMNGEIGARKTKIMAGVEIAAITTVTIIGFAGGGPAVWFGAGPLLANHLVSSVDAYKGAKRKAALGANDPTILEAQRNLELSQQMRYDREISGRESIRDRVMRAGEQASAA